MWVSYHSCLFHIGQSVFSGLVDLHQNHEDRPQYDTEPAGSRWDLHKAGDFRFTDVDRVHEPLPAGPDNEGIDQHAENGCDKIDDELSVSAPYVLPLRDTVRKIDLA